MLVSDQAGKSNILAELERLGVAVDRDDPRVARLLDEVKEREALGYAYEGADASFVLLARRVLGEVPHYFDVERFSVNVERRYNAEGRARHGVRGDRQGDGRRREPDLGRRRQRPGQRARPRACARTSANTSATSPTCELLDYRVRIFQGGSDAVTRVLIECGDGEGERWSTVGVSANIIDASFQALVDVDHLQAAEAGARLAAGAARRPEARLSARLATAAGAPMCTGTMPHIQRGSRCIPPARPSAYGFGRLS